MISQETRRTLPVMMVETFLMEFQTTYNLGRNVKNVWQKYQERKVYVVTSSLDTIYRLVCRTLQSTEINECHIHNILL